MTEPFDLFNFFPGNQKKSTGGLITGLGRMYRDIDGGNTEAVFGSASKTFDEQIETAPYRQQTKKGQTPFLCFVGKSFGSALHVVSPFRLYPYAFCHDASRNFIGKPVRTLLFFPSFISE